MGPSEEGLPGLSCLSARLGNHRKVLAKAERKSPPREEKSLPKGRESGKGRAPGARKWLTLSLWAGSLLRVTFHSTRSGLSLLIKVVVFLFPSLCLYFLLRDCRFLFHTFPPCICFPDLQIWRSSNDPVWHFHLPNGGLLPWPSRSWSSFPGCTVLHAMG